MSMISKWFEREEFACKCGCKFDVVDVELLTALIDLREYFGVPVVISSGCRCIDHNREVGGVKGSMHVLGKAADVSVKGFTSEQVCDYLNTKYYHKYGIGLYSNFVHLDVRGEKKRWFA